MFAPLNGCRILDLTHVLAGPYCTQLLALLGAEVIKIEPPDSGDMTRRGGPIPSLNQQGRGLGFCAQNADKASLTVNLKSPAGLDIVKRLVAEADVFVENYRPGVAERLGIGYSALLEINPQLVYVSLTAYGQDGPIGHRPAFDHVVQAMSGIMETTGTDETGPIKVGAPYVDYATGQKGAFATLAAIMEQRRTGQPQRVDVAMLDSSLLLMANTLTATANTGRRPP
jgi:crotonobetainyl-CoA:carnitine CoA-transferase CaiB-like acyl-CoA transferase